MYSNVWRIISFPNARKGRMGKNSKQTLVRQNRQPWPLKSKNRQDKGGWEGPSLCAIPQIPNTKNSMARRVIFWWWMKRQYWAGKRPVPFLTNFSRHYLTGISSEPTQQPWPSLWRIDGLWGGWLCQEYAWKKNPATAAYLNVWAAMKKKNVLQAGSHRTGWRGRPAKQGRAWGTSTFWATAWREGVRTLITCDRHGLGMERWPGMRRAERDLILLWHDKPGCQTNLPCPYWHW